MSINVTKIEFFEEGEESYSPAWKPYRGFEIDYGIEKLSLFEESSLEYHEYEKLYFSSFRNELKSFREDTNLSFAQMAEKYGDISVELKEFRTGIESISAELKEFRTEMERFLTQFLKEYSKKRTQT